MLHKGMDAVQAFRILLPLLSRKDFRLDFVEAIQDANVAMINCFNFSSSDLRVKRIRPVLWVTYWLA
jgi:hypothetical protein